MAVSWAGPTMIAEVPVSTTILRLFLTAAALALLLPRLLLRAQLALAQHASLGGHARLARWVSRRVPHYAFGEQRYFDADGAPAEIAAQRRAGFERLADCYAQRFAETIRLTAQSEPGIADLQFTARYRVPFQFSSLVQRYFPPAAFAGASCARTIIDLDGNRLYDLSGSYGVNVFGYDFYKECIERGAELVRRLGPVLGCYHPLVFDNVRRLRDISGLDEVSFHMSGTEAVMQGVRLARYHTRRRYIVCFCGAYHGWWEGVQPGVGNPLPARDTLVLKDMDEASLRVLRHRRDIACVLVNPLQALHPNSAAPSDGMLMDSARRAGFDRGAYAAWLRSLRQTCTERGIALLFDEVMVGFRLAPGGAQEYFGVRADLVTYGKTVAGGLPVGVLCGRGDLMRRFRDERPANICFARGTFNSHPYVMGAMHEFLRRLDEPDIRARYRELDQLWDGRAARLNQRLLEGGLNARVANLSSIWTVCYPNASRYNWMLQYYLRTQLLALSWVGSGRLIFSLDYSESDFAVVAERFQAAARQMHADGWWWCGPGLTNKAIRRRVLSEMLWARVRLARRTPMPSDRSTRRAAGRAALGDRA